VTRLGRSATLVHRLAAALAAKDKKAMNRAVKQLAAGGSGGSGGVDAVATAIRSYDASVVRIRTLAAAVERERVRLDKSLH